MSETVHNNPADETTETTATENAENTADQTEEASQIRKGFSKIARGNRVGGIIVALCMVVLGIVFLVWPVRTDIAVMYVATVGFVIYGVYEIVVYVRTPSDLKNGWLLANGILLTLLGFLILFSSPASMLLTFTFILGFFAMFSGITQITGYAQLHKACAPGCGWVLASGIINLLLGIFFLLAPFAAAWVIGYVLGIYLIVGGIALFAESASGYHGHKT